MVAETAIESGSLGQRERQGEMSLPPEVLEAEYKYGLYSKEAADVRVRYLKAFGLWPTYAALRRAEPVEERK